ncbi:MAG: tetratricopeptide repeat protein [Verrucomicrobiales bacterium]|nr:tetratricopeptide repeat protein [Verrucomicrobiales bacterium]
MSEKPLNQISRDLRDFYQKGTVALERQNLDYAISILEQVVLREPACLEARQALRAAQIKKHGTGGGFFKKMIGGASSSPLVAKGQLALRKDPKEAMQIAEQILSADPNSSMGNKLLAEAALAAGFFKTACFALEIARRTSPKDQEVLRRYAQALTESGQVDKAEQVYLELIRSNPGDTELAMEYKNLSAKKTMEQQGYEALADGSGSYRDILKNKDEATALEQEGRQVKSDDVAARLIADYEARLQVEPNNLKLIRNIAELYTQKKEFDLALEFYQKIKATPAGNDPSLDKVISETQTRKYDHLITQLDPVAEDFNERKSAIEAERLGYQIAECRQRADQYPTDLQIKFELAELYFKAGKVTEAIQEFQKAQANPHRKVQCTIYLGRCFAKRNMNDLAARKFQEALKEKPDFDDEKKDLVYQLGSVLEVMGKKTEAMDQFKQLYEVDISYRDVAAKVDAYYAAGGQ